MHKKFYAGGRTFFYSTTTLLYNTIWTVFLRSNQRLDSKGLYHTRLRALPTMSVLTKPATLHRLMSPAATIELTRIRPPPLNSVRFFTEEPTSSSPHVTSPFPHTEEPDESSTIHPPWKRNLYQLLEQPTSSTAAFIMHMFTTSLIVVSAFVTVLETVPAVHSISTRVWFGVETSVVALFTVEYIARLLAWSNTWSTLFHWMFCTFILVFSAQHAFFITPENQ